MIAGGSEACIDPISMNGFCRLRAMSTNFNDTPALASRPFDANRDGFVNFFTIPTVSNYDPANANHPLNHASHSKNGQSFKGTIAPLVSFLQLS
jgi:hypothetical protein